MKPNQQHMIDRLKQTIQEQEARITDYNLLGEIKQELLACRTSAEAYQVLSHHVPPMFPGVQGALYVRSEPEQAILQRVMTWGGLKRGKRMLAQHQCKAVHGMKAHHVANLPYNGLACAHVNVMQTGSCLCVPLLTEGKALGALHLQGDREMLTPWKRKMAEELGSYCAVLLESLRLREELSEQVVRDPLTGLFNRRYMEESLRREFAGHDEQSVGIIMIDIDNFANYNKKFTHEGANELLRKFADFLQERVRGADVACRYAGDEFLLILPGASAEVTEARAETIRKEIKQLKVRHRNQPLGRITLSLGVAASSPGWQAEEVLQAAVSAVGQAKARGRDRVVVDTCPQLQLVRSPA